MVFQTTACCSSRRTEQLRSRCRDRARALSKRRRPWTCARRTSLQGFGLRHQRGDASQEAAGGAAVEHAMVKAEGEIGFGDGDELLFLFVPERGFAPGAHAEHEGLFGEWNGRGPGEAEGAEICNGGDRSAGRAWRESARAGEFDQLVVAGDEFFERLFVGAAD